MVKALYMHPDSGTYWEQHCDSHLIAVGYIAIPEWRACYFHPEVRLLLAVYVDEFKLAGPAKNLEIGWKLIRLSSNTTKGIDMA